MDKEVKELFQIAIEIEELMEKLYLFYAEIFPEHLNFFVKIAEEEREHAELLTTIFNIKEIGIEIKDLNLESIDNITEFKNEISITLDKVKTNYPTLKEACMIACKFESSASELHIQNIIMNSKEKTITDILKFLGKMDECHYKKLKKFMKKNNL